MFRVRPADDDAAPRAPPRRGWRAFGSLLGILVAFFLAAELESPYYFLQDDNRDYTLPLWVGSARAAAAGELGEFNFYQSLGMPLFASGQSGGLTPFSYAGVGLSHLFLGHPYAAIDIAVFLSFLVGAAGSLFLARQLGLSDPAGVFFATAWCLSPFNVYLAVSWVLIAPLVAFLPWILGLLLALYRTPAWTTFLALVTAHALLFFSGYVPWLMFLAVFEVGLFIVLVLSDLHSPEGTTRLRRASRWLLALPFATALASAPLLLPMVHQMSESAYRADTVSFATFASQVLRPRVLLNGLLQPFRRLYDFEMGWQFLEVGSPPAVTHLGYVTLVFLAVSLWSLRERAGSILGKRLMVGLMALAGIALIWSFGWLSPLMYQVPMFNRLRWPFRLLPFAEIFLFILAAVGFETWWRRRRHAADALPALASVLMLHAINLGLANLAHDQRGFYEHLDPVPISRPNFGPAEKGRTLAMGVFTPIGGSGYTAETMGFNYPMLWGYYGFAGYETMMPRANAWATLNINHAMPEPEGASYLRSPDDIPVEYLREWGVRWYSVTPRFSSIYGTKLVERGILPSVPSRHVAIFEDSQAKPLVFWSDSARAEGLTWRTDPNRLVVAASAKAGALVTASFLYQPFFEATLDGEEWPVEPNELGQTTFTVPAGEHEVIVRYRDPYLRLGILVVAIGAGIALLGVIWARERGRTILTTR